VILFASLSASATRSSSISLRIISNVCDLHLLLGVFIPPVSRAFRLAHSDHACVAYASLDLLTEVLAARIHSFQSPSPQRRGPQKWSTHSGVARHTPRPHSPHCPLTCSLIHISQPISLAGMIIVDGINRWNQTTNLNQISCWITNSPSVIPGSHCPEHILIRNQGT
jgi:hypothetical protein